MQVSSAIAGIRCVEKSGNENDYFILFILRVKIEG